MVNLLFKLFNSRITTRDGVAGAGRTLINPCPAPPKIFQTPKILQKMRINIQYTLPTEKTEKCGKFLEKLGKYPKFNDLAWHLGGTSSSSSYASTLSRGSDEMLSFCHSLLPLNPPLLSFPLPTGIRQGPAPPP